MPLFRTYQDGALRVGVWKADESVPQLLAMLSRRDWLEPQLSRLAEKRQHEWLAVRVLLKSLCGGEEKEIAYLPSGRPFLADGSQQISISHTRGYVAVALHPAFRVGLDIEQYGPRVQRVASRFIRPDEVAAEDDIYALLLHWSAKETLFKLIDEEGVDFLEHLRVLPFAVSPEAGDFEACEYKTARQEYFRVHYVTHPDFVLTWAVSAML